MYLKLVQIDSGMTGTYNIGLVGLCLAVAIVASYTALNLAGRVQSALKRRQLFWFLGGALAMGTGIWATHFIAMLAFGLPVPVRYSVWSTLLSLVCAISASGIGLWLQTQLSNLPLLCGASVCTGIAIAGMHYIGMAAMQLQARIEYDWGLVGLSVAIAVSTSFAALWLAFRLQNEFWQGQWQKLGSAFVMGVAIIGMHYTGMWATCFIPLQKLRTSQSATLMFNHFWLAIGIGIATLFILSLALLTSLFDQRLNTQILREQALQESVTARQQAEEVLLESAERERAIAKVIQQMRSSLNLETIFSSTTQALRQALKCDRVLVYRFNLDWSGEFVSESVVADWKMLLPQQINQPELNQTAVDKEGCTVKTLDSEDNPMQDTYLQETQGGIYRQGKSYTCVSDIYEAGYDSCYLEFLEQFQARAYIVVPIFFANQLWGLLATYQNSGPRAWKVAEIKMVVQIATQFGVAIQQAELFMQTQRQAEELKTAKEAADAANRAKSNFLAHMSHELRTPLNAILGFTQLMYKDQSLSDDNQQYLNIISRSGQHLLKLINNVLEMSKIEAGRTDLNESSFDLYRLLDTLNEMLRIKASTKGLELTFECEPKVPQYMKTDESKLTQVLLNLLGNAINFTKQGHVNLRVSLVNSHKSLVKDKGLIIRENVKKTIRFEVEDTGAGIAPDELKNLFEPFEQTETGLKSVEGTGLGLPISKNFVQLMGGAIAVSSQPGVGSVFSFDIQVSPVLDLVEKINQAIGRKVISLAPGQPTYRILIAEDNPTDCLLLVTLLSNLGFDVREAGNGQEVLAVWEHCEPHLIWMDMQMPVMDGYEVTKRIKATLKGQATVVIALTANAFEEHRQSSILAGCDDYLRKPFEREELLAKLSQHLGVLFVYKEEGENKKKDGVLSLPFNLESSLKIMPAMWVEQLYNAALQCNDDVIFKLIEQIPEENSSFAVALTNLAEKFQFNQITTSIQHVRTL